MRNRFCLTISSMTMCYLLAGCTPTTNPGFSQQAAIDQANLSRAEVQLANAATSVTNSLVELAAIQKAVYPAVKLPDLPDANKIGMGQRASIDWTGPIEPLIKNIGNVSGYNVRVIGKAPPLPVLVSINKQNAPLAVILRDAAFQCGDKVNIVLYPTSKVIEMRYARV